MTSATLNSEVVAVSNLWSVARSSMAFLEEYDVPACGGIERPTPNLQAEPVQGLGGAMQQLENPSSQNVVAGLITGQCGADPQISGSGGECCGRSLRVRETRIERMAGGKRCGL